LVRLGEVPASFVREVSDGVVDYPVTIELDEQVAEGGYDLILSVGQIVPHEVIGMANQNKNLFVGVGGQDVINKTHFLGAAYGMERVMGRADSPVRRVLDYASEHFTRHLPICYVLTVRGKDETGELVTRGLYIGDDAETYQEACRLSQRVNLDLLDAPLDKVVVYLDPDEFKSTWLGNKAVYRTRMAMADGGELIVLAPGLREFGEDAEIDRLIRKYGYHGTPATLAAVEREPELAANLSAAAHLIHGSSEGRFRIRYGPGQLCREEIEGVGFEWLDLAESLDRYRPGELRDGFQTLPGGERIFYISNPALGLWALRSAFEAA
jgi:nickel-dependent lactate racemase